MKLSTKLAGSLALALTLSAAPMAFADSSQNRSNNSNGYSEDGSAFDSNGESHNKIVSPAQGRGQGETPVGLAGTAAVASNGISYRGGKVMTDAAGMKINIIWYGTWNDTQTSIVRSAISGLNGSSYYKINTTYYDAAKKYIVNALTITSESFDAYSQGAASVSLSDAQIWNVVAKAATGVNSAAIKNTNAVTLVLTSADVKKTGFLTSYCGWHSYNTTLGTSVKYSFVGNPGTATSCGAQAVSINGDRGADAMASIIAHEIEEAATDPELNAWYDSRGYENADKCAWNFGTTTTDPSGYKWNQTFGGKKFLIQQNWVNAGGGSCKQGI